MSEIFGVTPLWERLKQSEKPVLLYGTGDGADKIISVLEGIGIKASGVFVSDGFKTGRTFRGYNVINLSDAEKTFGDFSVLVSFGTHLQSVIDNIVSISERHRLYIPDVPLYGNELFDGDFFLKNEKDIYKARGLFIDEASKKLYDDLIKFKLSGEMKYLFSDYKTDGIPLSGGYDAFCDIGAYTGDTIKLYTEMFPSIKEVFAFEPSERAQKKLSAFAQSLDIPCRILCACAGDCEGETDFYDGGGRGSHIGTGNIKSLSGARLVKIKKLPPDIINIKGRKLLIKYDAEGGERDALSGSLSLIRENETELAVSLYHKSEDLFSIPLYTKSIYGKGRLFLRRGYGIPAWDIMLYACI